MLQEWLPEAFTMWGIAAMVIVATLVGGAADSDVRGWVYRVATGLLVALAALTALTGARTPVVWFKICPFALTGSAALLVAASLLWGGPQHAARPGLPAPALRPGRRGLQRRTHRGTGPEFRAGPGSGARHQA